MSNVGSSPNYVVPAFQRLCVVSGDLVDLLFRLLVGLVFVPHGYGKLFVSPDNFVKFFGGLGFSHPEFMTYFIGGLEFFGGLAVAIGFLTRPLAFMLFVDMAVAAFMVHLPKGWSSSSGGAEYVVTLAIISLVCAARGSGRYSVDRLLIGREL